MNSTLLFSSLDRVFHASECLSYVKSIYESDHWFSFSSFQKTSRFCAAALRDAGLSQVEQLPLSADGKTRYGDWVIPQAWDAKRAVLRTEQGEVLADYEKIPCSLVMYSAPTPVEGITAEVVFIPGSALESLSSEGLLKGKLLFTDCPARDAAPYALKNGAVGILTDFIPLYPGVRESRRDLYGESRWENDFILPKNETGLFAFSLSPEKGDFLRSLLAKGPVRLTAEVETSFYNGSCDTISAALMGTDPSLPEVMAYGHLYEPGANDNASGCGVLLELAKALNHAISRGILPRPRRTIRFIMGYECTGSMGYLASHPERRALCCAVADMVGTEDIDRTHLTLWHNPLSNWSFTDAAILAVNRLYQEYAGASHSWEERPFTVGSDNIIGDPIFRIPTTAMITEPALSYHSSLDHPGRIDPAILKRDGMILGAFLYTMADAGAQTARFLEEELLKMGESWQREPDVSLKKKEQLSVALGRALASLKELDPSRPSSPALSRTDAVSPPKGGERIPCRLVPGCLTFYGCPWTEQPPWKPAWSDEWNLPLFWADGKRNLWNIAVQTSLELGEYSDKEIAARFERLLPYFEFLAEHRYIAWK